MDIPIIVTVENVLAPDNDMKLLIDAGQTVMDVKRYISNQAGHFHNEQCLLHDGRLLQDHETIDKLIPEEIAGVSDCCTSIVFKTKSFLELGVDFTINPVSSCHCLSFRCRQLSLT